MPRTQLLQSQFLRQGLVRTFVPFTHSSRTILPTPTTAIASFSTTTSLPKKKSTRDAAAAAAIPPASHSNGSPSSSTSPSASSLSKTHHPEPDPENPAMLDDVTSRYTALDTEFRERLQKSTAKGRITPDVLGKVLVKVAPATSTTAAKPSKPSKPTKSDREPAMVHAQGPQVFPLSELAQVVAGRSGLVRILVNEQQFVKPIMSAIQNSDEYNQQPQKGESDLELVMHGELVLPEDQMRQVSETAERWKIRIREVRASRERSHKDWKARKVVLPDTIKKVDKQLGQLQERELAKVEKLKEGIVRSVKATQL